MSKVKLLKIVIKLKNNEINLTLEDAEVNAEFIKELKQMLEDIFKNSDKEKEYVPYPVYPANPYPTWPPQYWYAFSGSSDSITISRSSDSGINK